jgi:serine phosphatase RsbU (regulator of sigma subunit)
VRQPLREIGRAAVDVLMEAMREPAPSARAPVRRLLPAELVIRESCGCLAHQADVPVEIRRSSTGLAAFRDAEPAALAALRELAPSLSVSGWEEPLYRAFTDEVGGRPGAFSDDLRAALARVSASHGDVDAFQRVLTLFWQWIDHHLDLGSPERKRADGLLQAARLRVARAAKHELSARQTRFVDAAYKVTRLNGALGIATDHRSVERALAEHLPPAGIADCYLCLYDGEGRPPERSRLVAAVRDGQPLRIPSQGVPFATDLLVPGGLPGGDPKSQYVIGSLARWGAASPGYVVFKRGAGEGFLYELLFQEIGGTMGRLRLLDQLLAEASLRQAAERRRLEEELLIARRIQTGILPKHVSIAGLEVAAVMLPATEVGGDYYDMIPTHDGCWFSVGDVAGHGLPAGLVMLMLQSVVSGLVRTRRDAQPVDVLPTVNDVLFENIRERLAQDEFITFTLLRYYSDGRLAFAGAHEDILLYRARERRTEWLATPGIWLGATRDVGAAMIAGHTTLEPDDVMLLYTDGVLEARNEHGEEFGAERLAGAFSRLSGGSPKEIVDVLIDELRSWTSKQDDDVTFLVVRRLPNG